MLQRKNQCFPYGKKFMKKNKFIKRKLLIRKKEKVQKYCQQLINFNVIDFDDEESFENQIFSKCQQIDLSENTFLQSQITIQHVNDQIENSLILNPFDLSDPQPKHTDSIYTKCSHQNYYSMSENKHELFNCCDVNNNSFDSGFVTESSCSDSILSFASRSNYEDRDSSFSSQSDICSSKKSEDLLSKLKHISDPVSSCQGTGYLLPIVADSSSNDKILIPQISPLTLANILLGNHKLNNNITVFDCRFPYEYSGGHIDTSLNVHNCQKLLQTLFPIKDSPSNEKLEEDIENLRNNLKRDDTIHVFYCEFSSYRAPQIASCLRRLDRSVNGRGRGLYIPNIYVLFGGYKEFYSQFPELCCPKGYVPMKQIRYQLRQNHNRKKSESDSSTNSDRSRLVKGKKEYLKEFNKLEYELNSIMSKSVRDTLQLFSSHSIIGSS